MSAASELQDISRAVRREVLERSFRAGIGHLGGTFSVVDILVTLYYLGFMRSREGGGSKFAHDRLILSKGHSCLALYSILHRHGVLSDEDFDSFGSDGGLGAQLDTGVPGIDWNTGSLGHAVGIAAGMALGEKLSASDTRVFALVGDAEYSEGSMWEGMHFAADYGLSRLVTVVDRNRLSVTSTLDETGLYKNFREKVEATGWQYLECDGHSFSELRSSFDAALSDERPSVLVANTLKGKGVSFMEGNINWHHGVPAEDDYLLALAELS